MVEGGSEEVTLLLGRRETRPPRPILQVREKEEVHLAMARRAASMERREEKREEKRETGPKAVQEVTLVLGKENQVMSMAIMEENETVMEEVHLAISPDSSKTANLHPEQMTTDMQVANLQITNLQISDLQIMADLRPEVVEEVTLSMSADFSFGEQTSKDWTSENISFGEQTGKDWTIENVNKYGSVLMVCEGEGGGEVGRLKIYN
jgi:hypothetical protein